MLAFHVGAGAWSQLAALAPWPERRYRGGLQHFWLLLFCALIGMAMATWIRGWLVVLPIALIALAIWVGRRT